MQNWNTKPKPPRKKPVRKTSSLKLHDLRDSKLEILLFSNSKLVDDGRRNRERSWRYPSSLVRFLAICDVKLNYMHSRHAAALVTVALSPLLLTLGTVFRVASMHNAYWYFATVDTAPSSPRIRETWGVGESRSNGGSSFLRYLPGERMRLAILRSRMELFIWVENG